MKKLFVVAAIAVAGCAARTPEQKPATPAQRAGTPRTVEVATFTAEVDPAAGTLRFNSEPTAAGRALGMSRVVETTSVSLTTILDGTTTYYFNVEQRDPDRLCTNDWADNVWGGTITITNTGLNRTLSNVYAQIQTWGGSAGNDVCNSLDPAEVPPDITDIGLGLWYSPVMVDGSATQYWTFQLVSLTAFTFTGRILASVAELFPVGVYPAGNLGIVDNGTGVVYSDLDDTRLVFLEPAGSTWNYFLSSAIPDLAWALSKDANKPRIWYATGGSFFSDAAYVGYVNSTDHGEAGGSRNVQGATAAPISVKPWAIATDPDGALPESRAWFVASNFDNTPTVSDYVGARLGWVDREGGGTVSVPTWVSNLDGTLARSLVFADADNIYVTLAPTATHPNGAIQRCTKAGCGVTPDIIALPPECQSPDVIVVSPTTGNLWFTAGFDSAGGGVCTFDPLLPALVSRAADAAYPSYLAVGPAGEVWVGEYADNRMQRIVEGELPFYVSTDIGPGYGTAWALGKLWVVTFDGVNRITP